MNKIEKYFKGGLYNTVGIDLGTSSTIVHVDGAGTVFNEPTLVTLNRETDQYNAIGTTSRRMSGRTPEFIEVVQPIKEGVVFDYDVAYKFFEHIYKIVQEHSPKIFGSRVTLGIPCNAKQTEVDTLKNIAQDAGARSVSVVYEPLAAAVGMGLNINREEAIMIIDIGGGTTDVMVLSSGEMVNAGCIKIAGDLINQAIQKSVEEDKNLSIGMRTAEDLKISGMKYTSGKKETRFKVSGRNTDNNLPGETSLTKEEILKYISEPMQGITDSIEIFIQKLPPEILSDLKSKGIYFVGGGTYIEEFSKMFEERFGLKVIIPEDPVRVVSFGCSEIAKNINKYKDYLL